MFLGKFAGREVWIGAEDADVTRSIRGLKGRVTPQCLVSEMPMAFCPQPKPRPAAREDRRKARAAVDRRGSAIAKARSEGRCEVVTIRSDWRAEVIAYLQTGQPTGRCINGATQVHHMIGGRGQRGIGLSALAEHKQHVCVECRRDITGDVGGRKLLRVGGQVPYWTDRYQRVEKGRG